MKLLLLGELQSQAATNSVAEAAGTGVGDDAALRGKAESLPTLVLVFKGAVASTGAGDALTTAGVGSGVVDNTGRSLGVSN